MKYIHNFRLSLFNRNIIVFLSLCSLFTLSCAAKENTSFSFDFKYEVIFDQEGILEAWIPIPQDGPFQTVQNLSIDTVFPYELETDSIFGNLYLHIPPVKFEGPDTLNLQFRIHRREASAYTDKLLPNLFLQPYDKVPLDPQAYALINFHENQSVPVSRRIYDAILKHMQYDKSGTGWGLGDAVYACDIGKGNCTDYHSLFNALMRLEQIPAKFNVGFPIPDASAGLVKGYHCWAEFYQDGKGWIPVDISDADKNPGKEDYYFGRLDNRRVKFTVGRDIPLPGGTKEDIVNFSVYPHVRIDGILSKKVISRFTYVAL